MLPMKLVNELLQHKSDQSIWSIGPNDPVFTAIERMAEHEVGALLVLDQSRLVGIVTERDYARKVILRDKSSKQIPVAEIMTQDVITVTSDLHIDECVNLMKANHVRHLPVIDDAVIVGMLSLRDLFSATIEEQASTIDQLQHYIRGEV